MLGQSKLYLKKRKDKSLLPERYVGVNLHRLQWLQDSASVFFSCCFIGFYLKQDIKELLIYKKVIVKTETCM